MHRLNWAFLAGATALTACAPVENQRGYVPDVEAVASVQVGMDTKDTITKKLGDPSTSATFGNDIWYYISAHVEQNAFFAPRATDRNILAVEFAKDGKVTDVHKYTLADGRCVGCGRPRAADPRSQNDSDPAYLQCGAWPEWSVRADHADTGRRPSAADP